MKRGSGSSKRPERGRRNAAGPPNRHERRRAANAERILGAAASLFAAAGHADVTMDAVAEAADVSRATLFNHFAGKRDMLAAHHRRLFAAFTAAADEVERGAPRDRDPLARLLTMFAAAEKVLSAERALVRVLYAAVVTDDAMLAVDEEIGAVFAARIVAVLDQGRRASALRKDLDVRLAARIVVDLWTTTLRDWARREGGLQLRTEVGRKLEMVFRGFRR